MIDRTFGPAQLPASKRAARLTGTLRSRPLTRLRTIDETAELLSVSSRTVRRLVASGALQVHRFGRLVRIAEADIAVLLAANQGL
jgi:excisionase family DNA binding protein